MTTIQKEKPQKKNLWMQVAPQISRAIKGRNAKESAAAEIIHDMRSAPQAPLKSSQAKIQSELFAC